MENTLILSNISFSYGNSKEKVIDDFSLKVEKGSFTTLLGASGSGKTTLLRLISGFLEPVSGQIIINGQCVNKESPENRKIGMVFQDYALFPHMSVEENIMYGLKLKNNKVQKSERKTKEELNFLLHQTSQVLDLDSLLKRFPSELSGGQQQRVALGRALILEPGLLLMDEPLSSLDTKLRQSLRTQLKEIQQRLNITTVYVTHDQEEALSLSDKIAVLENGKLSGQGTSKELYFNPQNRFTAQFIGNSNFIIENKQEYLIRPEWICIHKETDSKSDFLGAKVIAQEFLGSKTRYKLETKSGILFADTISTPDQDYSTGAKVMLEFLYKKQMPQEN